MQRLERPAGGVLHPVFVQVHKRVGVLPARGPAAGEGDEAAGLDRAVLGLECGDVVGGHGVVRVSRYLVLQVQHVERQNQLIDADAGDEPLARCEVAGRVDVGAVGCGEGVLLGPEAVLFDGADVALLHRLECCEARDAGVNLVGEVDALRAEDLLLPVGESCHGGPPFVGMDRGDVSQLFATRQLGSILPFTATTPARSNGNPSCVGGADTMTGMASAPAAFDASRMLSFDLETTSVNPLEARIVTSALVRIDGREVTANETLADPGVEIPEAAAAVHGISTEKARAEGRPHDEVLRETVDAIKQAWDDGLTLIVFNAPYDLSVLRALTGDFTVTGPVFDPLLIDRARDRYRKGKRNLGALCEHYGVRLDNAHEATSDAMAAARIAWKQVRKVWPELAEMDTDDLMEYQAVENYRIQTDLKKWLESRGRDASNVSMGWPMVG